MMGIADLRERFGLSDKAVRRRLDALSPVIAPFVSRGENNAILLSDAGVAIFDRLIQVERETKRGLRAAAELVISEVQNGREPEGKAGANADKPAANRDEVIELLRAQVEDLRRERDRLLAMLEAKEEQIRALMPGPSASPSSGSGGGGVPRPGFSRWRAFKYALLGR